MKTNMMMKYVVLSIAIFFISTTAIAETVTQQKDKWGWFSAISIYNNWHVSQGYADVKISGKIFSAKLFDSEGDLTIEINGQISQDKITATAILKDTDAEPCKMTGEIKYLDFGKNIGTDILLHEIHSPAVLVVGLTNYRQK